MNKKPILLIFLFFLWEVFGQELNVYFANLHSHTFLSDGEGSPIEAYSYAKDSAKISVLAITDHTHYLSQSNYEYLKTVADLFSEEGKFVALVGQEFGLLHQFGHFTILDGDSLCPSSPNNLSAFHQWVKDQPVIAVFNHPRRGDFADFDYDFEADRKINLLEIFNGSGHYGLIFEEEYLSALSKGWKVGVLGNQDNHKRKWGDAVSARGSIFLTGILANELSKKAILEALKDRKTYAFELKPKSDSIILHTFKIDTALIGEVYLTDNPQIKIEMKISGKNPFSQIYLYKNGKVYDSLPEALRNRTEINWRSLDSAFNDYYFFKGIQNDSDLFYTSPIWVIYRKGGAGLKILPQPSRKYCRIVIAEKSPAAIKLKIYGTNGQKIKEENINPASRLIELNITGLESGVYFIDLETTHPWQKKIKGKVIKCGD